MSEKKPLLLEVTRSSWSALAHHGTEFDKNKKMLQVRETVLKRDKYTCQACNWRSLRWQEIHHRNGDHDDFSLDNLEVRCPLCHQVSHLPTAASTSGGSIIWLPEVSQAQLNLMCIAIFVAIKRDSRWATPARALFNQLDARKTLMEEQLSASDPGLVAQVLLKLSPEEIAKKRFLEPLRLLPFYSRFEPAIEYWAEHEFKNYPDEKWEALFPAELNLNEILKKENF